MSDKSSKKIFGKTSLLPWKPAALPPALPAGRSLKALKASPAPSVHRRELFEPILSRPIELDKLATEVVLRFRDIDGEHEIKTCYGDIYKIVNVFMDYARLLELIGDEWDLDAYHRAVNEVTADKLRSIAKKYQEAIGYDYEDALAKCEAKKKKARKDDDVGGDALELAFKKNQRDAAKKKKEKRPMFRVIIAGGRNFANYELLSKTMDEYLSEIADDISIVCGQARGADTLGEKYGKVHGYAVNYFPAKWNRYGKSAGYIRNTEMAKNADALVAFWDGHSLGTKHMIDIAEEFGLDIRVIQYKN